MTGSQDGRRFHRRSAETSLLARAAARAAVFVVVLFVPAAAQVATTSGTGPNDGIWFADGKTVKQIDVVTHDLSQQIPLQRRPEALAVDPNDHALWVLTPRRLLKFDGQTNPILEIDLRALSKGRAEKHKHKKKSPDNTQFLTLNPYDQSVWLASDKRLHRLSAQGELLQTVKFRERIRAVAPSPDETLWVIGNRRLWQVLPDGTVREPITLPELIDQLKDDHPHDHARTHGKPEHGRFLAIDALRGILG